MNWQVIAIGIAIIMAASALKEIATTLKSVVVELAAMRETLARTAKESAMRDYRHNA